MLSIGFEAMVQVCRLTTRRKLFSSMYKEKIDLRDHVQVLKGICPMPNLMERIGLGDYAKKLCKSPFREDRNPSFGVFQSGSNWFFKDHATGESGDEIKLLALHHKMDPRCDFMKPGLNLLKPLQESRCQRFINSRASPRKCPLK